MILNDTDLKKWIVKNSIIKNGRKNSKTDENWFIRNGYNTFLNKIKLITYFLDISSILPQRLYHIWYDLYENVNCQNPDCKKIPNFISFVKGYRKTCSFKCAQYNPSTREKIKRTNLKKYGVENPSQSEEVKNKKRSTSFKNYGVGCSFQSEEVRNKIKQTNLERYGSENPFQSKKIKSKIRKIIFKKYGVEHILQSDKIRERIKKTNLKKYGVEYPIQSEEIKNIRKQKTFLKYGVEYTTQILEVKRKNRLSQLKRIKERCGQVIPNYNPDSISIIEDYGKEHGFNFQHAENGGEVCIDGYFPDGVDQDKMVIIEIDEKHHFNTDGIYKKKDIDRQQYLEGLGYDFIRIRV